MEGLSNLISGGNAVGILDSMTLRQESLMQLVLQGPRSEYMLHSVEKAVACGLNPAAFHLPYCLGEIPPLTENNVRIMALSEIILAPIAGLHMSPLMHALYTRRYSVVYAILVSKNPAWVVQTSKTALSDMLELPHRGGKLFGPIHVAAWTYVACESRSNCDTYATEIFSKLCQNPIQLASAIEIAINMENKKLVVLLCELAFTMIRSQSHYGVAYGLLGSVLLNKPWNGWGWGWRGDWQDEKWFILLVSLRKELKKIVIRDLAPLTQSPRAAETIRRSGDADKEPDISDREHNDKRIGYESQAELASTEDNGNRNSANTKASQQKRNETQNEKDGYGSAQGGKSFVNQQHKPMVDFDTLNESKPENDRQTRSSIGSNPAHPKNHIPSWGAQQRQWKVSGGKLSNGSGIMSLASKASASTASSGLSVISFGGMPFTQPRGRGLNFEKPALEEEPEFMDIDGIPTSPP
ncbi:hypothetical protein AOL_s00007g247 [Orbilia oligospora ATCC 24927]|uniref:Uncharacterized protein n=1 Tax=Arthrobotrys oligospora (strain ATCC 24927 / CBS 115.81 / DSM 1491) TaxID=756982 RepID=G1X1T8_ARTOA|nr:hypothetical protein AOL_s00007g247 [Orbilia oligospora ATCC 24927]EGX52911.1 hypothetical protein AOL_s00007g247 [Orbilia oligospora ATCC 24927]